MGQRVRTGVNALALHVSDPILISSAIFPPPMPLVMHSPGWPIILQETLLAPLNTALISPSNKEFYSLFFLHTIGAPETQKKVLGFLVVTHGLCWHCRTRWGSKDLILESWVVGPQDVAAPSLGLLTLTWNCLTAVDDLAGWFFIFFNWDTKYQKPDLAIKWLGEKMHLQ